MEGLTAASNKEQVERRSPANEAGQSLLEVALLLPILCLLVVGITDIGRAAAVTIMVNNAATAGVEYRSRTGTTASDTTGMQNAATNDTKTNNLPGTLLFPSAPTHGCMCDTGDGVSHARTRCPHQAPAPISWPPVTARSLNASRWSRR